MLDAVERFNTLGPLANAVPFVEVGPFDGSLPPGWGALDRHLADQAAAYQERASSEVWNHHIFRGDGYDEHGRASFDLDPHRREFPAQLEARYGREFIRNSLGEDYFDDAKRAHFVAALVDAEMMLAESREESGFGVLGRQVTPREGIQAARGRLIGISDGELQAISEHVEFEPEELVASLLPAVEPTAVERVTTRILVPIPEEEITAPPSPPFPVPLDRLIGLPPGPDRSYEPYADFARTFTMGSMAMPQAPRYGRQSVEELVEHVRDLAVSADADTVRKMLADLAGDDDAWAELIAEALSGRN